MFFLNPYAFASTSASLDELAVQPRAVWSLRKLISGYSGSCLRLRRSSDSGEQDIGFSGSSIDTSAISAFVGSDSAYVVTWYDQTGNGEHMSQSTASQQPRLVNAGFIQSSIVWDDSNDSMTVTSLTMGSQYCGIYSKSGLPSATGGTNIILEMTTNYNVNAQSFVIYSDTTSGGPLHVSVRNSTSASDFRQQLFPITAIANSGSNKELKQHTILMNRATTGSAEIQVWQDESQLSATVTGTPPDTTGNFTSYDLYVGSRAGSSLFSELAYETLVIYNADTSAQRTSVQSIVA